jgi:tRNA G37 N-methylase Trm5
MNILPVFKMTCPSRLHYLLGDEQFHLEYPSLVYLDFITPAELFSVIIKHVNIQIGGLANKVVWDMFAGIGTDSIRLASVAGKVISTELNPETYACLVKNIKAADVPAIIECHNADATEIKFKSEPDVIYFDPPWGDDFKSGQPFSFETVHLSNGKNVMDVYRSLRENYKEAYFIVKAPYMCDMESDIPEHELLCILSFRRQKLKYYLIFTGS